MPNVTLLVNGAEVPLSTFAHRIILNVLSAILNSLKLDEPPREAVFRISD